MKGCKIARQWKGLKMSQMDKLHSTEHGGCQHHSWWFRLRLRHPAWASTDDGCHRAPAFIRREWFVMQVGFTVVPCKREVMCLSLKAPWLSTKKRCTLLCTVLHSNTTEGRHPASKLQPNSPNSWQSPCTTLGAGASCGSHEPCSHSGLWSKYLRYSKRACIQAQ